VLLTVHLLEVGDLIEVADVDNSEVLDTIGDTFGQLARACDLAERGTDGRGLRLVACNQDPNHDRSG
jgi:hypothetical protein